MGEAGMKVGHNNDQHPADLIVHHRQGTGGDHNLVIVELKVNRRSHSSGGSTRTLEEVAEINGYQFAVFLDLDVTSTSGGPRYTPSWEWLCNGQHGWVSPELFDDRALQEIQAAAVRRNADRLRNIHQATASGVLAD